MSSSTSNPDAPRVLVAHHHSLARSFIADNLAADGYQVSTAADLAETHTALQADHDVAAVILDLRADTIAVLDHLAELDEGARPQVLVLTGKCDSVNRGRLLRCGADDVIAVPVGYTELRQRVDARLGRRRLAASHSR